MFSFSFLTFPLLSNLSCFRKYISIGIFFLPPLIRIGTCERTGKKRERKKKGDPCGCLEPGLESTRSSERLQRKAGQPLLPLPSLQASAPHPSAPPCTACAHPCSVGCSYPHPRRFLPLTMPIPPSALHTHQPTARLS